LVIAKNLNELGFIDSSESQLLIKWDMFNQNQSSPFFDQEWMFDEKEGFDIVIGNPPYGVSIKDNYRKNVVSYLGNVPDYEIYYYFIQVAEKFIIKNGILSYIIPNTYLFNTYAGKYREDILKRWNILEILDCTKFPIFENAVVRNTINIWKKESGSNIIGYRNTANIKSFEELLAKNRELVIKWLIKDLKDKNMLVIEIASFFKLFVYKIGSVTLEESRCIREEVCSYTELIALYLNADTCEHCRQHIKRRPLAVMEASIGS